MASLEAQSKWRHKNKFVKRQLNIMARKNVHDYLEEIAEEHNLRGKGEAVTFTAFVTRALVQRADFDAKAAKMLDDFTDAYPLDRDIHAS